MRRLGIIHEPYLHLRRRLMEISRVNNRGVASHKNRLRPDGFFGNAVWGIKTIIWQYNVRRSGRWRRTHALGLWVSRWYRDDDSFATQQVIPKRLSSSSPPSKTEIKIATVLCLRMLGIRMPRRMLCDRHAAPPDKRRRRIAYTERHALLFRAILHRFTTQCNNIVSRVRANSP